MKAFLITLILLGAFALICFVRDGADFPLPQVIPALDGRALSVPYFLGGLALLVLMIWGLRRLQPGSATSRGQGSEEAHWEEDKSEEDKEHEPVDGEEEDTEP